MSDKTRDGLDRRHFVTAAIASGAAAVAAGPGMAAAQQATPPSPAGGSVSQGTVYTGDAIQGKKIISALNLADLEPGKKHFLSFQGVQAPSGRWVERQGGGGAEGRRAAQRLWRDRRGIHERGGRHGIGVSHRCDGRAGQHPGLRPLQADAARQERPFPE